MASIPLLSSLAQNLLIYLLKDIQRGLTGKPSNKVALSRSKRRSKTGYER
jgi:hypothetical protein